MDDEKRMEKRVAANLAALRRRRNAVMSLMRALEEYSQMSRPAAPPRRPKNFQHRQTR
ncbi:MAG: hypothetical protein WDO73_37205 [Ignavibacteriota bacterium]